MAIYPSATCRQQQQVARSLAVYKVQYIYGGHLAVPSELYTKINFCPYSTPTGTFNSTHATNPWKRLLLIQSNFQWFPSLLSRFPWHISPIHACGSWGLTGNDCYPWCRGGSKRIWDMMADHDQTRPLGPLPGKIFFPERCLPRSPTFKINIFSLFAVCYTNIWAVVSDGQFSCGSDFMAL